MTVSLLDFFLLRFHLRTWKVKQTWKNSKMVEVKIPSIKLSDGRDFPLVGLGTFRVSSFNCSEASLFILLNFNIFYPSYHNSNDQDLTTSWVSVAQRINANSNFVFRFQTSSFFHALLVILLQMRTSTSTTSSLFLVSYVSYHFN